MEIVRCMSFFYGGESVAGHAAYIICIVLKYSLEACEHVDIETIERRSKSHYYYISGLCKVRLGITTRSFQGLADSLC